ncbi:MAG: diguanylate cyclase response regulator [Gammaproteobacteria bacterium]|jgi:diguanylate cyclase (GGDEF)-like protein|nr:MAG: diguanylate cyclase response regulator [Gammaproteobacteria bacterium]PHR84094.1 MAG: diguanylate cyclase response regulator [Colwellia sp.]
MAQRLLVVEDSKPIATVIKQIAQSLNYEVVLATTLAQVEEILSVDTDFFAATIDYALPDALDGEAIACVLSYHIPSVVMTGKMDDLTRQKILAQPVIDYIPKENSQAFLYLKRVLHWQQTNSQNVILVVDDSFSARNHIVELLKRRNFTVYTANNGVQALEKLKQYKDIKMVITDLEMPEMDGIELTNEIRKKYSRELLAVIGISGASNGIHSARFIKNGADDFLRKPFCPEEFYCRITQNIESLNNIAQIQHAANTDYLTELFNRRAFFSNAEQRIVEYTKRNIHYCLAVIDIDYFKKVNDNYGHDAGDQALKILALYMRKHFGAGLTARLGGEEFSVLLHGLDTDQLYNKLDDFRRDISVSTLSCGDNQITITISIGVVFDSREALAKQMNDADNALYVAKDNGRNQVVIFGSDDQ